MSVAAHSLGAALSLCVQPVCCMALHSACNSVAALPLRALQVLVAAHAMGKCKEVWYMHIILVQAAPVVLS